MRSRLPAQSTHSQRTPALKAPPQRGPSCPPPTTGGCLSPLQQLCPPAQASEPGALGSDLTVGALVSPCSRGRW